MSKKKDKKDPWVQSPVQYFRAMGRIKKSCCFVADITWIFTVTTGPKSKRAVNKMVPPIIQRSSVQTWTPLICQVSFVVTHFCFGLNRAAALEALPFALNKDKEFHLNNQNVSWFIFRLICSSLSELSLTGVKQAVKYMM